MSLPLVSVSVSPAHPPFLSIALCCSPLGSSLLFCVAMASAEADPEADHLRILLATDMHLGYAERDAVRGLDSIRTLEEVLQIATREKVTITTVNDLQRDTYSPRATNVDSKENERERKSVPREGGGGNAKAERTRVKKRQRRTPAVEGIGRIMAMSVP